jgi:hypothetical protein
VGEVFLHLRRLDDVGQLLGSRLDFEDPARGIESAERGFLIGVPELVGREEAAVGQAGATVLELDNAVDLGLEAVPDSIKQFGQRALAGGFPGGSAAVAGFTQFGQVYFQRVHAHEYPDRRRPA